MNISPPGAQRRCFLLHASTVLGMALSVVVEARRQPAAEPVAAAPQDPLLADASALLAGIFEKTEQAGGAGIPAVRRHEQEVAWTERYVALGSLGGRVVPALKA
jgi:hypothetical protein